MENYKSILTAIALASAEFDQITKNKTARIPTKNGNSYSYKYADYSDIMNAIGPALKKNGLAIFHFTSFDNGVYLLKTTLIHISSGESLSSVKLIPNGLSPQEIGSFETYMKRYNTCGLLNIISEEDDDGFVATNAIQKHSGPVVKPKHFNTSDIPF